MVDVNALNLVLWGVLISCAVAVGAAILAIGWAWLLERRRQAHVVAGGIRAAEEHLAEAARDHTAT